MGSEMPELPVSRFLQTSCIPVTKYSLEQSCNSTHEENRTDKFPFDEVVINAQWRSKNQWNSYVGAKHCQIMLQREQDIGFLKRLS